RPRSQRPPDRDGAARGAAARPRQRRVRAGRRARLQGRQRSRRRIHARHRASRAAGHGAAAARAIAPLPGAWRSAPRQGRRHTPGAQALVYVGARPCDGAAHAGALLERGGAHGRARARAVPRAPSPDGGCVAVSARAVHLRAAHVTQTPLLVAHGLTAGYGSIDILHDVSLEVRSGEIVSIIGPNGAGKSTAFKTVVGFLRPRTGHVLFNGEEITGLRPDLVLRRGLAYVPQG